MVSLFPFPRIMPPRRGRPRTHFRGEREPVPPPSPSPPPSPPPEPAFREHAGENEVDYRQMFEQLTRTMSTAFQGRRITEGADIKRVKELGAQDYYGGADPAVAEA